MSKRFCDTDLWEQDWFIDLPKDYKLFWFYLKDKCNHAGIFKPNIKMFNVLNECEINAEKALELFNLDKDRVRLLDNGRWYLEDFIRFQYGATLNKNNRVHLSIIKNLIENKIELTSIRGLNDLKEGVKDKDKDKDKDKEKDKEEVKDKPKPKSKKPKEIKHYFPDDDLLNEKYLQYLEFRKQMKKPLKDISIESNVKKLMKLSANQNDVAIEILDQSIANGWIGLFELKTNNNGNGKQATIAGLKIPDDYDPNYY